MWFSIQSDGMPKTYSLYWCFGPDIGIIICELLPYEYKVGEFFFYSKTSHYNATSKITHYQPLVTPEPP